MKIPFIDLQAQRAHLGERIDIAMSEVLSRGDFIQGQAVREFENKLSAYTGARNTVTCANGTDALTLVGMAEELGPKDAFFVPAFTFVASAEALIILGATPYFVDILPDTFNIDPESLNKAIAQARNDGLRPRMIVAVDLFGQPADYPVLKNIAAQNDLILVADAAQSLGGKIGDQKVGTFGDYTTTSFFPAKPLGCYGDGGAVFTEDDDKAALLKSLTQHGKGSEKYDNIRIGLNSRLDSLQAAILMEKLAIFDDELESRQIIAQRYSDALEPYTKTPKINKDFYSAWAQYTVLVEDRERLKAHLQNKGIPTGVYYPMPLSQQGGYKHFPSVEGGTPHSETCSNSVLSLPMHPYLDPGQQSSIIDEIIRFMPG